MSESTTKKNFFISYTGNDEKWALWINEVLEKAGYTTIIQALDFKAGANFVLEMHKAIENSDRTIALFSREYLQSDFCTSEWIATLVQDPASREYRLIPIRIDESYKATGLLKGIRYIDLTKINKEDITKEEKDEKAAQWLNDEIIAVLEDIRIRRKATNPFTDGAEKKETTGAVSLRQKTNLPFERNDYFTGREQYLKQIEKTVQSKQSTVITQSITGLGGIGKTQLAVEYIYRNESRYDLIWWFKADSEEEIRQEYIYLAQRLGTTSQDKTQELAATINFLESTHQKWLLVFDNVDSIEPKQLKTLLPKMSEAGHILITSRQDGWHGMNCKKITLELWQSEEAKEYLLSVTTQRYSTEADEAKALELSELLGYLPLAIEHAAAYIENEKISIQKYIEIFTQSKKGLKHCFQYEDLNHENIAITWEVSFEKAIKQEEFAEELSNLLAFFAPEGIPWERLFDGVFEDEKTNQAINALTKYSLITKEYNLISMHRMVQHIIRENVKEKGEMENYVAKVLKILSRKFLFSTKINNYADLEFNKNLYPHAMHILQHEECRKTSAEDTRVLLSYIGIYLYRKVGYYDEALKYHKQALEMDRELGYKQGEAADLGNIGLIYRGKGDLEKALNYHKQALEIHSEVGYKQGEASQLGNIGLIYRGKGDLEQALN